MVNIISDYIPPFAPLPNIAPFTYKDGETYLSTLDRLRTYVNVTLVDFVNTNYTDLGASFNTEVSTLITTVNSKLAAQDISNDADIQAMTDYVNVEVAKIINSSIVVQDPVLDGIITNTASASRLKLDTLYAGKGVEARLTTVETVSEDSATDIVTIETTLANRLSQVSLDARHAKRRGSLAGLKARLDSGNSATMLVLADSTSNGSNEWVGLFLADLAIKYPNLLIRQRMGNPATNQWAAPLASTVGIFPGYTFDGGINNGLAVNRTTANSITGDLDVRWYGSVDNWAAVGEKSFVADFNVNGSRAWMFFGSGANLSLYSSADGTNLNLRTVANVLNTTPFVNGVKIWLRATLDIDNGAAGSTVKFYYSNDGLTWTQLGTDQVQAGTTTIFQTSEDSKYNIMASSNGASRNIAGTVYEVEIRDGIDGRIVVPTLPDSWAWLTSAYDATRTGAQVLDVWNASMSGYAASTFYPKGASALVQLMPGLDATAVFISLSHNDNTSVGAEFSARITAVLNIIKKGNPVADIILSGQNPQIGTLHVSQHEQRQIILPAIAKANDVYHVGVYNAMIGNVGLYVAADGVHPLDAGSQLWAQLMIEELG